MWSHYKFIVLYILILLGDLLFYFNHSLYAILFQVAELTEQLEQFRDQLIERDEQLQQMAAQIVISEKRSEGVDELKSKIQQLQVGVAMVTSEVSNALFAPIFENIYWCLLLDCLKPAL